MKAELIIPNYDNDGSDNAALIKSSITNMCGLFGGATATQGVGYWVSDAGKLYEDEVTVIVAASLNGDKSAELRELAQLVLDVTDQEAVFMSFNGQAEIIE